MHPFGGISYWCLVAITGLCYACVQMMGCSEVIYKQCVCTMDQLDIRWPSTSGMYEGDLGISDCYFSHNLYAYSF